MQPQTIGEYIAKHGEQPLWAMPGPNWVGQDDDGQLVIFPARAGGWDERKPFVGSAANYRRVSVAMAVCTGYPRWERSPL